MKSANEDPAKKIKDGKNDATEPFSNVENDNAIEINNAGDDKSRNYMGKETKETRGPNWHEDSKDVDGDTGQNAGVFK